MISSLITSNKSVQFGQSRLREYKPQNQTDKFSLNNNVQRDKLASKSERWRAEFEIRFLNPDRFNDIVDLLKGTEVMTYVSGSKYYGASNSQIVSFRCIAKYEEPEYQRGDEYFRSLTVELFETDEL